METDYISREAAIDLAKDIRVPTGDGAWYRHRCIDPQAIRELPPADVRPVVYCRDCVWMLYIGYHYCNKWCFPCPEYPEFFCAYGERRTKRRC